VRQILDGFQFYDNPALNKKTKTVSAIELHFLVDHWEAFLPFYRQFPNAKFLEETFFVGGFE